MLGVILAAGEGTRMGNINMPKGLLDVGGTSIIKYQIQCFRNLGIQKIIIVTGYNSEQIKSHLGNTVEYVHNSDFATTNNLYSMWKIHELIIDEFVCVYSDLLFHKETLKKCLDSNENVCLMVEKNVREETMKVKISDSSIVAVNKQISIDEADGNFIGMAKFTNDGVKSLFNNISKLIKQDNKDAYYTLAIENMIKSGNEIGFEYTENYPWLDIDEQEELEKGREIYKNIIRGTT